MGVGISKQSDSIRSSVIKGGELISKSEVDRKSIGEQEPIENPDASELASPFNEATFYQNQGVGQIQKESKPPSPQPDPVEETQNLDDKIGNIRKNHEEVEEPENTPRAPESTPRRDENLKTSLMQNVFLKLGINRRTSVSITDDNVNIKVDEKLPEEKSCSSPNPVGESSDGYKDEKTVGVDGGNLCDEVEQDSPIGRRSLMQITGEFPR